MTTMVDTNLLYYIDIWDPNPAARHIFRGYCMIFIMTYHPHVTTAVHDVVKVSFHYSMDEGKTNFNL